MIKFGEFAKRNQQRALVIDHLLIKSVKKELEKLTSWDQSASEFVSNLISFNSGYTESDPISESEIVYENDFTKVYQCKKTEQYKIDVCCFNSKFAPLADEQFNCQDDFSDYVFKLDGRMFKFVVENEGIAYIDTLFKVTSVGNFPPCLLITLTEV